MEEKALQVGATVLALALTLRLAANWERGREELGRTLLFISSGRLVTETLPPETEGVTEPVEEAEPIEDAVAIPVFGEKEEPFVQVNSSWDVDILSLLEEPLEWNLKGELPTVLILHSHATESFEKEPGYEETSPYRTLDTNYNMVSIGSRVAEILEAGGIRVIHDKTLYDYPNYNGNLKTLILAFFYILGKFYFLYTKKIRSLKIKSYIT